MGRTKKQIPVQAIEQAEKTPEVIPDIAKQTGVTEKTIRNRVKEKKLAINFVSDNGDATPPSVELLENANKIQEIPQIDYFTVAKSFISTLDMVFFMIGMVTKGKIEYERLTDREKITCAEALKSETKALDFLANSAPLNHLMAFGMIASVFAGKFKIKKKEEKKIEKIEKTDKMQKIVSDGNEEKIVKTTASDLNKHQSMITLEQLQQSQKLTEKYSSLSPNEKPMFADDFPQEEKPIVVDDKLFLPTDPSNVDVSLVPHINENITKKDMREFEKLEGGN